MKILIRLPNWLGDVVMSTAFIASMKQFYPDAVIDVILKKELSSIALLIPGINKVHPFSKQQYSGLSGAYSFGIKLKSEKYDLFFNLPTSLSSLILGWATGIKKRIGFNKEGGFLLSTNSFKKPLNVHRVDEYVSLLEQFTGKLVNDKQVKLTINKPAQIDRNRVLINFNSEAFSRRMPVNKGVAITNLLTKTFTTAIFTFIGSVNESIFLEQVINEIENKDRIENLAGQTSLAALTTLMAGCAAILTTDSGPAHLANSIGTPVIVLFGAGNEYNTAPYNKQNLTVLRYGQLSCEPCMKNTCELYTIPKCMELLDGLQIINTLSLYLRNA